MSNTANKKSGKNKNKNASDTTTEAKDDKVVDTTLEGTSNEKPDGETNGDATGDGTTNTETKVEGDVDGEAPAPAEAKKEKKKAPKKEREKKAPKEKVDAHLAKVEAFGKAALVGIGGEVEHGSAIIHNLKFGNQFRDACGGTELLPAAEKVGLAGTSIDMALKHKLDAKTRSHHQTVTFQIPDAPLPREIVIACAAANQGRPLARLATFGAEVQR